MTSLNKYAEEEQGQNILIYGPPKSGKTALTMELANQGYRVHDLDLERGAGVATTVVDEANFGNVNIYSIEDTPRAANAIKTVSHIFNATGPVTFCAEHGVIACLPCKNAEKEREVAWETIDTTTFNNKDVLLIDSLTQLSISAMVHSTGGRAVLSTKKAEWDDYSAQGQLLDFVLTRAQAAKFHTIFISHEKGITPEGETQERIMPVGGTVNYSRNLGRFFDHMIYCQVKNMKHQQLSLSTDNAKIMAGNRYNLDLRSGDIKLADFLNPSKELREKAKAAYRNGNKPVAPTKK